MTALPVFCQKGKEGQVRAGRGLEACVSFQRGFLPIQANIYVCTSPCLFSITTNVAALNSTHLLSSSFWGLEVWRGLSWVLHQRSQRAIITGLVRPGVSPEALLGKDNCQDPVMLALSLVGCWTEGPRFTWCLVQAALSSSLCGLLEASKQESLLASWHHTLSQCDHVCVVPVHPLPLLYSVG